MKYRDENGKDGRYSGDVNEDHEPHGQGKIKYKDGTVFTGVFNDGSQVHGKTSKRAGTSKAKSSKSDWARAAAAADGGTKTVRKMKWLDYYGDPGEYTGEVDAEKMPEGRGSMKYDHGLIQEGLWKKGQFIEGSDMVDQGSSKTQQRSGQRSSQETPPKSRSSRQGKEKRSSSSGVSSSRGVRDP
jgi:hypothetical protein